MASSVSVTADVSHVDLASGDRAKILTQEEIDERSLRGRDLMDAVALLPGIVDTTMAVKRLPRAA